MPYREKTAWLMLLAIIVAFGPYFLLAARGGAGPLPDLGQLLRFAIATGVQVLVLAVGHALLALRAPDDARASADERDRAIEQRAIRYAYYVLITGMILVGCVMPFTAAGWQIINAAIFMIVVAELTHYGVAVACYRAQS